jgi:hypothetical protein
LRRGQAFDGRAAYRFGLVALTAAVIFSNVLSPQYFVWALPVALLLSIEALPQGGPRIVAIGALVVCIAAATTWLFPYHYFNTDPSSSGLIPMRPADGGLVQVHGVLCASGPAKISLLPATVLALRNFLYLAAVIWLGMANRSQAPGSARDWNRKLVAAPLSTSYSGT